MVKNLLAGLVISALAVPALPADTPLFTGIGMATNIDNAAKLGGTGLDFITLSTGDFLMPDKDDETFAAKLEWSKSLKPPVLAVNGFIRPPHLKCVGSEANHDAVMAWAETVFRRAEQAGVKFVVFGSAGARRVPDGWPLEKARAQFVEVLKRMGPAAAKHHVTVVVEQLQPSECNFLNHIRDGAEIIRKVGHPNVRLLADLYHIRRSGDTPEDLRAAADTVVHVEIAELKDRAVPGVNGDDFRPFFRVLRESGYKGLINIEAKGADSAKLPAAISLIRAQEGE